MTKVSVVSSISAIAPTVVDRPPANPCLLYTIPETTLTGTMVYILSTYDCYGGGSGHV
jgi:hypothetical protein